MGQLVKIKEMVLDSEQRECVIARDLHRALESKQKYSVWIESRIESYGFVEGIDYVLTRDRSVTRNNVEATEHAFSIPAAKELCMVERTEKGKQVRRYFIDIEKKWQEATEKKLVRSQGKVVRKMLTDTIQAFIEYASNQGSTSPERYYINFSKMVNDALLEFEKKPENIRDNLNVVQLHQVSVAEHIITKSLIECTVKGLPYKDIFKIAKEKINVYASTVGRSRIGESARQTLLLETTA